MARRVTLTAAQRAKIRQRARGAGVSMAEYMRRAALGEWGPSDAEVRAADEALMSLPPERRVALARWLLRVDTTPEPDPNAVPLPLDL